MRVLIVDDEKNIRATLAAYLETLGCTVASAGTADAALSALASIHFDLAFVDLRLQEASGLDLIPRLLAESPNLAIVMVTAYAAVETAVDAIRRGAYDYLAKPFSPSDIRRVVDQIDKRRALESRVLMLEDTLRQAVPELELSTKSAKMRAALEMIFSAASSEASVLIRGESGTGKNVLARAMHSKSPRASHPFVAINVATLSDELLVSELFGHARGSFTGAVKDQPGRVEQASGGTLFLDEIAELSPAAQAKFLRFLQDKSFERLGENRTRQADVRIVAATNRDLEARVKSGEFREDLYYRVGVIDVVLPPLRERREDVPDLAQKFLSFFAGTMRRPQVEFSPGALQELQGYDWPGNIRELRNTIERALVLSRANLLDRDALPERMRTEHSPRPSLGGDFTVEEIEREHLQRVLSRVASLDDAARILGIDGSTLWRKRKKLGL